MGTEAALRSSLVVPGRRVLPAAALLILGCDLAIVLAMAGSTLGYDFEAYRGAADRLLHGLPLYDPNVNVAGGFAIYLYPPPFAVMFTPFALFPAIVSIWAWIGLLIAAFLVGTAILPVRREVRWLIVLLGGLMWPLLYSVKLGQVGPLLYLALAVGWRWLDRPVALGLSVAAGALVKVQPLILVGWAVAARRWRAASIAVAASLAAAGMATMAFGLGVWADYLAILVRVSAPVTTPHSFTPGAVAYQLGLSETAASVLQWACMAATIAITAWSWWQSSVEVSYLVTVVASQLLSPLLWDHYAMLLLIPVAWLLEQRQWWAALVPLALALPVVQITPPLAYPLCFGLVLVALVVVGATATAAGLAPRPTADHLDRSSA